MKKARPMSNSNIRIVHYEEVRNPSTFQIAKITVLLQDLKVIVSGIRLYENPANTWIHMPAVREIKHGSTVYEPNFYYADEAADEQFSKDLFDAIIAYRDGGDRDVG